MRCTSELVSGTGDVRIKMAGHQPVTIASLTCLFAWISLTSFIAFHIAALRAVIDREGDDDEMRGYVPKTRSVGTRPLGPTVSLIHFTAMLSIISDDVVGRSAFINL